MRSITSFIADNIVLCPSFMMLTASGQIVYSLPLVMMLCPGDTNTKRKSTHAVCFFFLAFGYIIDADDFNEISRFAGYEIILADYEIFFF